MSEHPDIPARFRGFVDRRWDVVHREDERRQRTWLRELSIENSYTEFMALYELFGLSSPEDLVDLHREDAIERIEIIKRRQRAFRLVGSSREAP